MRKPTVDYRNLRFNNLFSPEYRHLLLLFGWVVYFVFYYLTERFIPAEKCFPVHSPLDDLIPFCEYFIIPYVLWYLFVFGSLLYFLLYNVENFVNLQKFLIITQIVAMAVYIVFPNRQDLRPEAFVNDNFFTDVVGLIYSIDTNTGVCPSLHVAYSIGIASTFLKEKSVSAVAKAFIVLFALSVCVSVVFVKQHSVVDIFAALLLCLLAEFLTFRKYYKNRKTASEA